MVRNECWRNEYDAWPPASRQLLNSQCQRAAICIIEGQRDSRTPTAATRTDRRFEGNDFRGASDRVQMAPKTRDRNMERGITVPAELIRHDVMIAQDDTTPYEAPPTPMSGPELEKRAFRESLYIQAHARPTRM